MIAGQTSAQLIVDGRLAMWDQSTSTFLATVPDTCFNRQVTLTVVPEKQWSACTIEGLTENNSLTITNLTSETKVAVCYEDSTGQAIEATLQFTFLPIIQLQGVFGYDYQEGMVLLSCPNALKTDTLAANIKWRGGTTNVANSHKRNYTIKLPNDTSLLGMRKDNKWMLDAGQHDVFRLRNRFAMDIWNAIARKPYYADKEPKARSGVSGEVVEVFLNNDYRGFYNFSEILDRKQMKLKKVDKETGEIHGCLYKGVSWQATQMFDSLYNYDNTKETFLGYEVKYPELNDNDTTDWSSLVEANNFALGATKNEFEEHIEEYFDLPPIIDYSVFCTVVNLIDNSGKNMFWAIYDKATDKRLTPAAWDLDASFGQRWGGAIKEEYSSPECKNDVDVLVFYRFYRDNAFQFNSLLQQRYDQLRKEGGVLSTDSLIGRLTAYYQLIVNSGAARRESNKWSGDSDLKGETIDFEAEYQYICNWITKHTALIDECGLPLYYTKEFFDYWNGIDSPGAQHPALNAQQTVYSISGQRINNTQHLSPGIYIQNGRKMIVK
jgi:hypothetical protein